MTWPFRTFGRRGGLRLDSTISFESPRCDGILGPTIKPVAGHIVVSLLLTAQPVGAVSL